MLDAILSRIQGLLLKPGEEWSAIAREPVGAADLFKRHVAPLAAIPAVATFIGKSIVGEAFLGDILKVPTLTALFGVATGYALTLGAVWGLAWLMRAMAPRFGAEPSFPAALNVAAYAPTAAWLAAVVVAIPAIAILSLLGVFYSLYLAFIGAPIVMQPDEARAGDFALAAAAAHAVVFIALGVIISILTPSML